MSLSQQSLIEWASHWVPEENRDRFAEALTNELAHWTAPQATDKCGDGGKLAEILAEYDEVLASIPPELMAKDGDEADFVIRVCDYRALRAAVLSQGTDCPACHGSGEMPAQVRVPGSADECDEITVDCARCKGTGHAQEPKP